MPGHPDSSDSVAAPGAGNGRWRLWLWGGVGLLVLLVAVVWLALPWATCRWLRSQAPWDTGAVVITGAAWGGTPPPAMVVGVCDRATLLAIWRGSSGKSLPAALLANHQHAWGTFSAAPEITWRVDLDDLVAEPRITAAIPQALAEKLLAASLKADAPQLSRVHLTTVALTGTPQADGVATWTLALAGDAVVTINQQALPLRLTALDVNAETRLGPLTAGGEARTAGSPVLLNLLTVQRLDGEAPIIGQLQPWAGWLQAQARTQWAQGLASVRVPPWWPRWMHWDLRVVGGQLLEL